MTTITEQLIKGARIKGYVGDKYIEGEEFTGIFSATINNDEVTIVDKFPGPYNPNIKDKVDILEAEISMLEEEIDKNSPKVSTDAKKRIEETLKNKTEELAPYKTALTKINELLNLST